MKELIIRTITVFNNKTDEFVEEYRINHIPLNVLQNIFVIESDNPMYDCYPIDRKEIVAKIKEYIDINYDFNKYSYFVEASRDI